MMFFRHGLHGLRGFYFLNPMIVQLLNREIRVIRA